MNRIFFMMTVLYSGLVIAQTGAELEKPPEEMTKSEARDWQKEKLANACSSGHTGSCRKLEEMVIDDLDDSNDDSSGSSSWDSKD